MQNESNKTNPPTTHKKSRISSLQALRAIAFLGIFTSHCDATTLGGWGVSIFLILSGFVMYYTYHDIELDSSPKASFLFSMKKIKKLYPLHILMMLTAFIVMLKGLYENFSIRNSIVAAGKVILNLLLLQDWIPAESVYFSLNGVAWYLSLCFFLYMMFPTILRWFRHINNRQKAIFLIVVIYLAQILIGFLSQYVPMPIRSFDNFPKWVIYICPLFRTGDFTIGCCLGYLYRNRTKEYSTFTCTILEIVAVLATILSEWIFQNQIGFPGAEWFRHTMLYTLLSCAIVLLFAIKKGLLTRFLTNKVLIYLGNISAITFLTHQMIIRYFDSFYALVSPHAMNSWLKVVLLLTVTVGTAELYKRWK